MEDLQKASEHLLKALTIRQKYMAIALQGFSKVKKTLCIIMIMMLIFSSAVSMGHIQIIFSHHIIVVQLFQWNINYRLFRIRKTELHVLWKFKTISRNVHKGNDSNVFRQYVNLQKNYTEFLWFDFKKLLPAWKTKSLCWILWFNF